MQHFGRSGSFLSHLTQEGFIMRLDDFLNERRVPFERVHHRRAYSANRLAEELHVPGREVAKTVLVRTRRGYCLAVLPANRRIDMLELRRDLNGDDVELASEEEIEQMFPDCDTGAMPPFGSLYQFPTLVDEELTEDESIVFEGGNHEDSIRMSYRD